MDVNVSRRYSDPFATTRTEPVSPNLNGSHLQNVVEDIIIPHHLASAASGFNRHSRRDGSASDQSTSWNHHKFGQGNVDHLAHTHTGGQARRIPTLRSNSVSVVGFHANRFAVGGRRKDGLRKTSLPILTENKEAFFPSSPVRAPASNEFIQRYNNAVMFRSINAFTFEQASSDETYGDGIGSISIDTMRSKQSIDEDPLTVATNQPHTVTRQNTLIGRAGTIVRKTQHTIQQHRSSFTESFRRTSLWAAYDNAKVRGEKLQRKRWAQILWEYSIYVILLSFVYFVLIGLPLWKGAVYWLYWVFEHKFVVSGTFSITIGIAVM